MKRLLFCGLLFLLPLMVVGQDDPQATKKNGRPAPKPTASQKHPNSDNYNPSYFYTFERPGFVVEKVAIDHDESGKGQITFTKGDAETPISDPIQLSSVTLEKLKAAFAALNFLDAKEEYQYAAHDYSNMGNITISLKRGGRTRTVKYNWTINKDAKVLMDEYRRISNEFVWKFEIKVASENQPLQTPQLMDEIDSYLRRDEISDPSQLVPLLTELSMDERLPLIARNHAAKLVKQIQKLSK